MIDYSKFKKAQAEPEASSMIETFRAIGYSVEAAIADIIDNSISAGQKIFGLIMNGKVHQQRFQLSMTAKE